MSRLIDEFVIESLLAYQTVPHVYVISIDRVNQSIDRVNQFIDRVNQLFYLKMLRADLRQIMILILRTFVR